MDLPSYIVSSLHITISPNFLSCNFFRVRVLHGGFFAQTKSNYKNFGFKLDIDINEMYNNKRDDVILVTYINCGFSYLLIRFCLSLLS